MVTEQHIYVHVPFCNGKCVYCGFYSILPSRQTVALYIDALAREIDAHFQTHASLAPETVYFGGGTPSILDSRELAQLCALVRSRCTVAALKEWTVEGNPGTLTDDKIGVLRHSGVNRISLGAQAFDDAVLRAIGRRHTAADIVSTVAALRKAGFDNIGLDLIANLPGVTKRMWRDTLQRAVALEPQHVSVYTLSIEPGSRLARYVSPLTGRTARIAKFDGFNFTLSDEGSQIHALEIAEETLAEAGYERYELSNYALPGHRCLHNDAFWRGEDYIGFAPAAASRFGLRRWTNRADLSGYVRSLSAGAYPPREEETLLPEQDLGERLAFGLRLCRGLDLGEFMRRFTVPDGLKTRWLATLEKLEREDLVQHSGSVWRLTKRGWLLADYVALELI